MFEKLAEALSAEPTEFLKRRK